MRRYSLTYFIGQSFKGLWRNGVMSLASITVLMSCLLVMGSFSLLLANINYNMEEIGLLNEIVVFIDENSTDEQVAAIGTEIKGLDNVSGVRFISREEAHESEMAKLADHPNLLQRMSLDKEIYRHSYVITYSDNSRVSTLQYQLEHLENKGVSKIICRTDLAETIESLKSGITMIFIWFLAILMVVSIFVIINTIKLAVFARRQEISIMRYVGATNWFITLPFVFEGIFIGLLAGGIGYLLQWYLYTYVYNIIITDYNMISVMAYADISHYVIAAFLAIGVVTGIIGSSISLRKYLHA
ncbi:MAG: permease-like cell division protein FtsX [Clostridia bacterium]|nr:permease-like cell division protein FtsX [Clostridia bacterium]